MEDLGKKRGISSRSRSRPVFFARDITDRRQAETVLKNSEKHYRAIFETTGAARMILEEDATISLINKEFERINGDKQEAIVGKK